MNMNDKYILQCSDKHAFYFIYNMQFIYKGGRKNQTRKKRRGYIFSNTKKEKKYGRYYYTKSTPVMHVDIIKEISFHFFFI